MPAAQPDRLPKLERFLSPPRHNPTALRLILAAQLRRLRRRAGLTPKEASARLGCSASKISRLERGEVPLRERDVADLLYLYGVEAEDIDEYRGLVRQSNESGWWQQFEDVLPKWFDKFIGLQEAASIIRTYEVLLVPGLLQTPEYALAVAQGGDQLADQQVIERRVGLRLARQELLDYPDPPKVWAVLEEAVLHRRVADRAVMRGQLQHLAEAAERPHVQLQIIPFDAPGGVTSGSPITHLRFEPPSLPEIVYLEHGQGALYLDKTRETERYRSILDGLLNAAECPEASLKRIHGAITRYC
ncbi:helix-turn-helix domain-containing protein [Streptomyces acidicola]|uniref:helix-turn-helix domain-containing protein n=1 Tax=Streptomyces acidicola TaxID=2596892 RepID=UPI00342EB25C